MVLHMRISTTFCDDVRLFEMRYIKDLSLKESEESIVGKLLSENEKGNYLV